MSNDNIDAFFLAAESDLTLQRQIADITEENDALEALQQIARLAQANGYAVPSAPIESASPTCELTDADLEPVAGGLSDYPTFSLPKAPTPGTVEFKEWAKKTGELSKEYSAQIHAYFQKP